jgi:hypothetical protein
MSVYLIYREPYNRENCKYVKRFPNHDLLGWIHHLWEIVLGCEDGDELSKNVANFLGAKMYGFWFYGILEEKIEKPATVGDAAEIFSTVGYITDVKTNERNFIQLLTDDDELGLAFYLFDHTYLEEKPELATYLTIEGFNLPVQKQAGSSKLQSKGLSLFFESHLYDAQLNKIKEPVFIPNLDLAGLPQYLVTNKPLKDWRIELMILRACSLDLRGKVNSFDQMMDELLTYKFDFWNEFMRAYYLREEGQLLLGEDILQIKKALSEKYSHYLTIPPRNHGVGSHKIQREQHLFQVGIFHEDWGENPMFPEIRPCYLYDHWVFFESGWAEEFPYLANSIEQYFTRWDVLQ